jgi:hypothetical protein
VVPVVKPKAYLPDHWDGLWGAFDVGVPQPFSHPAPEPFLQKSGVAVIKPEQYMEVAIGSNKHSTCRQHQCEEGARILLKS